MSTQPPNAPCVCRAGDVHTFTAQTQEIACSLDAAAFRARMRAFGSVFAQDLLRAERVGAGTVRWCFADRDGLFSEILDLAAREHACCSFFHFEIRHREGEIWWESQVEGASEEMLEMLFALPETLRVESAREGGIG